MEGRRRGVTHIAEPGVFIEESVLIGKPLGEQQHCTGTLLLVLHLLNLPFSLSFCLLLPPSPSVLFHLLELVFSLDLSNLLLIP